MIAEPQERLTNAPPLTFSQWQLTYAREVIVVQLELLGLVFREAPAVPVNAMVRADLVDLMARCSPKIKPEHLARRAIVYLRQSSDKQVRQNLESQRLQYEVAERIRGPGSRDVEIRSALDKCIRDLLLAEKRCSRLGESFKRRAPARTNPGPALFGLWILLLHFRLDPR
jgi:hypothetical protein